VKKAGSFKRIWSWVKRVPSGRVATYGQIARALAIRDPRVIGWALHANKDSSLPCHRVVDRFGFLADGFAFGGWREQKKRLAREGVGFIAEKQVDLKRHLFVI